MCCRVDGSYRVTHRCKEIAGKQSKEVRCDARRELDPATAYLTLSCSDLTARFPWPSDAEQQPHKKSDRNNSQKDQRNITRNAPARSLASFLSSIYLPASSFAAARRYPGE